MGKPWHTVRVHLQDGQKWEVCVGCKRIEDAALAARAKEADGGR